MRLPAEAAATQSAEVIQAGVALLGEVLEYVSSSESAGAALRDYILRSSGEAAFRLLDVFKY